MNEFDILFNTMMVGGFDFIFWIIIIASGLVTLVKGLVWVGLLRGIFSGLRSFTNPYGVAQAAPVRQVSRNDKLSLLLSALGLIVGIAGLMK